MIVLTTYEREFPEAWASALINGDYTGLDHADNLACAATVATLASHGYEVVCLAIDPRTGEDYEPRFTWSYPLYGGTAQGGNVLMYVVHRRVSTRAEASSAGEGASR